MGPGVPISWGRWVVPHVCGYRVGSAHAPCCPWMRFLPPLDEAGPYPMYAPTAGHLAPGTGAQVKLHTFCGSWVHMQSPDVRGSLTTCKLGTCQHTAGAVLCTKSWDTQRQGHCPCGQQVTLLVSLFRSPIRLKLRSSVLCLFIGNGYLHEELQVKILGQVTFANVVSWAVNCLNFRKNKNQMFHLMLTGFLILHACHHFSLKFVTTWKLISIVSGEIWGLLKAGGHLRATLPLCRSYLHG